MGFNFGWSNRWSSWGVPDPWWHRHGCFADEAFREQEYRQNQYERFLYNKARQLNPLAHAHPYHGPHPFLELDPYSHYMHESIGIDIQKRRIREELIMAEFARGRALEDGARTELMIERDLAHIRRTHNLPSHHLTEIGNGLMMRPVPSVATPDRNTLAHLTSLEERISQLVEEVKKIKSRFESQGSEIVPLQRGMEDQKIPETEHLDEGIKHGKLSGLKRKALAPPEVGSNGLPKTVHVKKKARVELSCALCRVSVSTEHALNEHLRDKKHKRKVDAMKRRNARKHYSIGLLSKRATHYTKIIETVDPPAEEEAKLRTLCIPSNETEEAETRKQELPQLQQNPNHGNLKNQTESALKEERSGAASKKNGSWCDMCKIGPVSQKTMDEHVKGKQNETKSALKAKRSDDRGKGKFWCKLCKVGPMSKTTILAHEKGKKHANHLLEKKYQNCGAGQADFEKINALGIHTHQVQNCGAGQADFEKINALGIHTHQVPRGMRITSDNIDETLDKRKLECHARTTKTSDDCVVGAVKIGDHGLVGAYMPKDDALVGVCAVKSVFQRLTAAVNNTVVVGTKSEDPGLSVQSNSKKTDMLSISEPRTRFSPENLFSFSH